MEEEIDRNDFEKRLKNTICALKLFDRDQVMLAIINEDTVFIQSVKDANTECQQKISQYLQDWDNAVDEEARAVLVGSVTAYELSESE